MTQKGRKKKLDEDKKNDLHLLIYVVTMHVGSTLSRALLSIHRRSRAFREDSEHSREEGTPQTMSVSSY